MLPKSTYRMGLLEKNSDKTGRGQSKMAASKLEMRILAYTRKQESNDIPSAMPTFSGSSYPMELLAIPTTNPPETGSRNPRLE